DPIERGGLPGPPARALRRGRPGDRLAPPPGADRRRGGRRPRARRDDARRRRPDRRDEPSGADRRPAGRGLDGEGARRGPAAAAPRAIVDVVRARAEQALEETGIRRLAIGGGVAANSELRERIERLDADIWIPDMSLCTDNAAMIAGAARFRRPLEYPEYLA